MKIRKILVIPDIFLPIRSTVFESIEIKEKRFGILIYIILFLHNNVNGRC